MSASTRRGIRLKTPDAPASDQPQASAQPEPYRKRVAASHEIPPALRDLPYWVAWKLTHKPGKAKPDKIPISPRTGKSNWGIGASFCTDFETASDYATKKGLHGVGFLLVEGCGVSGIDLDHCRDPQTGELSDLAQGIIDETDTYFEVSPGLSGVRGFVLGSFGGHTGNDHAKGIEFYDPTGGRFLTVTGDHIESTPFAIETRDLTDLGARYFPDKAKQAPHPPEEDQGTDTASDDLDTLRLSDFAKRVIRSGDVSAYKGDRSAALFGLAKDLVKAGLSDEAAARILCNPDHGISEKALSERGGDWASAMDWLTKYTMTKARAAVEAEGDLSTKGGAAEILAAAIDSLEDDPGAYLADEAIDAWAEVYGRSAAEYERLRARAKKAGARVAEIDRAIGARSKYAAERGGRKGSAKVASHTYESYGSKADTYVDTYVQPTLTDVSLSPGGLIEETDEGPKRLIDSQAAEVIAQALSGRLAWDTEASAWQLWMTTHWEPLHVPAKAERLIAGEVHTGCSYLGYRLAYLNGITQIMQRRGLLDPPPPTPGVVPFHNGLLDVATGTLTKATPERSTTWIMPHDYDQKATCPTIHAWILEAVEGDTDTVELLRAWLAALVRGIPLQRFLMLIGRGGSGKGTFQRLAMALVGKANAAISALRDLEENRFETAKLYGKRLCMINEAGKHGGSLNMLKAITGGDHLPLERKHQQQHGSFVFDGLVLMATNEDLQSSDRTSGLERRRLTVRFPNTATPEQRADWEARGGEEAILHRELPGLVNWLLELTPDDIRARIERPPARVVADNIMGMAAGNSVADWLLVWTEPNPDARTQIGKREEVREAGRTYYLNADTWLYASYLQWCQEHGRKNPVSSRVFGDTVLDTAETLGHKLARVRHPKTSAACLRGIDLRRSEGTTEATGWVKVGQNVGHVGNVGFEAKKTSIKNPAPKTPEQVAIAYLDKIGEIDPDDRAAIIASAADPAVFAELKAKLGGVA